MCQAAQPWFALEATACYRDEDSGYYVLCNCPVSTCSMAPDGSARCEYTIEVKVFFGLLALCFWGLVFAWMSVNNRIISLGQLRRSKSEVEAWAWSVLFPSDGANAAAGSASP